MGTYHIQGAQFEDHLLFVREGAPGASRSFGDKSCDGILCLIRQNNDQLIRLAISQGQQIEDQGIIRLATDDPLEGLQVDYEDETTLRVHVDSPLSTKLRIWGPSVSTVYINDAETEFVHEDSYVVLNIEPTDNLDDDPHSENDGDAHSGADGDAHSESDSDAYSDNENGSKTPSNSASSSGCGCQTSAITPGWLALMVGLVFLGWRRGRV